MGVTHISHICVKIFQFSSWFSAPGGYLKITSPIILRFSRSQCRLFHEICLKKHRFLFKKGWKALNYRFFLFSFLFHCSFILHIVVYTSPSFFSSHWDLEKHIASCVHMKNYFNDLFLMPYSLFLSINVCASNMIIKSHQLF